MAMTSSNGRTTAAHPASRLGRRERRNWRRRLTRAELPGEVKDLIGRTTDRTRLLKLEKSAVADELIAHFADGLDAGVSADDLIREFGDERVAAKLIRRAKLRNRPLLWQAWKFFFRSLLVLVGLYAVVMARYLIAKPTISVDYLAKVNAEVMSVPEVERGWPPFRDAMKAMGQFGAKRDQTLEQLFPAEKGRLAVVDATPVHAEAWPILTRWLDRNQDGLARLRQAAARPEFGFVLGSHGSIADFAKEDLGPWRSSENNSLVAAIMPHLGYVRMAASMLTADARYAATQQDGDRVAADITAVFNLAASQSKTLLFSQFISVDINEQALDQIEWVLANRPGVLSDAQLAELAHRAATSGGETASSFFNLAGERMAFYDVMQRVYSDDGHGNGHLSASGLRHSPVVVLRRTSDPVDTVLENASAGALSALSSRRDVIAEYDWGMDLVERALSTPLRDWAAADSPMARYMARGEQISKSLPLQGRYMPLVMLRPSYARIGQMAETTLGRRDGVCVGLALELYRRRQGVYPKSLADLTPRLLPGVPTDRQNGQPVRYRLIGGRPVVYSVGVDQDDDQGRPAPQYNGRPSASAAAQWSTGGRPTQSLDGDWLLFDGQAER